MEINSVYYDYIIFVINDNLISLEWFVFISIKFELFFKKIVVKVKKYLVFYK